MSAREIEAPTASRPLPNGGGSPPVLGQPLLEARNVTLQYKTPQSLVTAAYRVCFDVYSGDRFVLLGPSGCGKSSLLKSIGGFVSPVEGSFKLSGVQVRGPGPDRMMVFQEFDQLFAWKTVIENVMFPLLMSGNLSRRQANERASHYLDKVRLTKFKDSYPHTLSGGMKQRVAIARAMATDAERIAGALGEHPLHRAVRHPLDRGSDRGRFPHSAAFATSRQGSCRVELRPIRSRP